MDIRQLKAFAKVYEQKSFSRAAEELFLTQPTISAHIAFLEKQLKTLVFARRGKKITPTPAGELLYARCQNIFESMKQPRHSHILTHLCSHKLTHCLHSNFFLYGVGCGRRDEQ